MSQQINLFNPELRAKRDWLSLQYIVAAAVLIVLAQVGVAVWQRTERVSLQERQSVLRGQVTTLQDEILTIGKLMAERKGDPALDADILHAKGMLRQHEDVTRALDQMAGNSAVPMSGYFSAFSRQIVDGVWLTGFSIGADSMEIRGRMLDGALLPAYIRRLEGEANFHGKKFSTLEMKAVDPKDEAPAATTKSAGAQVPSAAPQRPFVEFVLLGVGAKGRGKVAQ